MKFLSGGPVTLSVTADGTYQTVDLTAHVPAADQGNLALALISVVNTGDSNTAAVRAVGSTDDPTADQGGGFKTRLFWLPKADANDQIEIKLGNSGTPNWTIRFWGYLTPDEAVGFVNPTSQTVSPGSTGVWTDADISAITGADTALAAIVLMHRPGSGQVSEAGVRVNGSTDEVIPDVSGGNAMFHIIGVDGSEIFEAYDGGSVAFYVAGYITANFTAITNMVDVTGSLDSVYEDIDLSAEIPADNTFMAGLVDHGGNSSRTSGLRQNGWTVDEQGTCSRQLGFAMGIDANRVMEHLRSTTVISLYLRGYGTEPAGGVVEVGLATETDEAFPVTAARSFAVDQAQEQDTAPAVTSARARTVEQAQEADQALPVTASGATGVGLAREEDVAFSVVGARKVPVGLAPESDIALPAGAPRIVQVGLALELDNAFGVTVEPRPPIKAGATGFISEPDDDPANTYYEPRALEPLRFHSSMFVGDIIGGGSEAGFGDVLLANDDGGLDHLLGHVFGGREVRVLMGGREASGKPWPLRDFGEIFRGQVAAQAWDRKTARFVIEDAAEGLDRPLQTTLYAGSGGREGGADLAGKPKPVLLGRVFHLVGRLVDAANNIWQGHDGPCDDIPAVYSNGASRPIDADYPTYEALRDATIPGGAAAICTAEAMWRVPEVNPGIIAADVRGDASLTGYVEDAAGMVDRLARRYGGLGDSQLDGASFVEVAGRTQVPLGLYITAEGATLGEAIDRIVDTVGGFRTFDRLGRLAIGIFRAPGSPVAIFTEADIVSIERIPTAPPIWRRRIHYAENHQVLTADDVAGSVDSDRRAFLAERFRTVTSPNPAIKTAHPKARDPEPRPSLFALEADAQAEADRQRLIYEVAADFYRVAVRAAPFILKMNDTVRVSYDRFGLDNNFRIYSIEESARSRQIVLGLFG